MRVSNNRRINLALQGGGVHGAFTWGVLDALLEDKEIGFSWVSATSAGAVNAAALACGLAAGGASEAQAKLRAVWEAVETAGVPDLLRFNPFLIGLARATSLLSPYDFNPLGFDPLRRLLEAHIDFELIRKSSPVELLIAATDISNGRAHLFRRPEITIESVLASACLPTLHHAVVIEDRAFWDGGFSANPDLLTLVRESPVEDTLIVLLNPLKQPDTPRGASEIADRVNSITFNQPLLRDVEVIVSAKEVKSGWLQRPSGPIERLKQHRFHLIEAGKYTASLSAETKIKPDKGLLKYLHGAGRLEAQKWLERHRASIGREQTVDLRQRFLSRARTDADTAAQPPSNVGRVA
jgi:NTE family protein